MNINATLILQSIAMKIFVWFCMKFLWPPVLRAMDERRERIAEGRAASDRAEKELEDAKAEASLQISAAREKAGEIVDQANQRHSQIVDQAREELRAAVAQLAVLGASKILEREISADTHRELLDKLIAEI